MNATATGSCLKAPCENLIPAELAAQQLCLDHFLDQAFSRANWALDGCGDGWLVDDNGVECFLSDALAVVINLEAGADVPNPEQRERMLELLLILASLHEYAAHQSIPAEHLA